MEVTELVDELWRRRRLDVLESHPSVCSHNYVGEMDREGTNRMIGWLLEKIEGLETENAGLRTRIDELLEQITKQSGQLSEQSVQLGELLDKIRLLRKSLEGAEQRESKYKRELSKLESQLSYARVDRELRRDVVQGAQAAQVP